MVAAAKLSDRYITDRFLPDKAIDLIDEAAAELKMQIESEPLELSRIKREIQRILVEKEALLMEDKKKNKDRLEEIEKELADKDNLVTFGIKPTFAETGFGYIQAKPENDECSIFNVELFL